MDASCGRFLIGEIDMHGVQWGTDYGVQNVHMYEMQVVEVDHIQYQHFRHQVSMPWTTCIDYLQFTIYSLLYGVIWAGTAEASSKPCALHSTPSGYRGPKSVHAI
jgi:hypothetical protein